MSRIGTRVNEKCALPGKGLEAYVTIKDDKLRRLYGGVGNKIPMQTFHDAYFEGKLEFKGEYSVYGSAQKHPLNAPVSFLTDPRPDPGDVLEQMEYRHDWATFPLTADHFRYVLTQLIPDVIFHSEGQDEDQVRDHYDRGDDFYEWFLGPRM